VGGRSLGNRGLKPLPGSSTLRMVRQVDGASFAASDLPRGRAAVLFTADWCGYCHRFYPHFKRIQEGWVVDLSDDDAPAWDAFAVRVVPTVILFEDRAPKKRWAGVLGAAHVEEIEAELRRGSHENG
jgi:thiol-disulfide isomerase/thioredoxin